MSPRQDTLEEHMSLLCNQTLPRALTNMAFVEDIDRYGESLVGFDGTLKWNHILSDVNIAS